MKYSTVEQLGGRGAGGQKRELGSDHTESFVCWCKTEEGARTSRRGRGLSHTKSGQTWCKVRGLSQ